MTWSDEHRAAAHEAATELQLDLITVKATIDAAHRSGLFVPPAAERAYRTLAALGVAWAANAAGHPTPLEARHALELPAIGGAAAGTPAAAGGG